MPFTKIEAKDYDGKGVTGLPDIPRLDTLDMQKKFDELAKDVAIPKHNVLVDELSGETAADNLGIADDIADFINPTKKIKPLLVTFAKKIKENSNDRHTHENKTVLDSITDTAIKAWNKVSNLFTNIDGVEDVVSGRTSKIPSSFAISQYVQQMGGGDMVQSIYDRNGNGIVDDAEALGGKAAGEYQTAESQELQTTSKSVVDAVNEVFNKTKDVLNTKEEIEGNTDPTAIAGALSVKELSNDLGGLSFGQDADGSWGYRIGGADPVIPFKSSKVAMGGFKFLGNNGNPNGATVDVGFKPDFIMYGFLGGSDITKAFYNGNSGNDRTLVLWWTELQNEFIWDSGPSNPPKCIRRSFPTGPSTGNRLALQEVTDTGFKVYGGYGSGAAFYVCIKLE